MKRREFIAIQSRGRSGIELAVTSVHGILGDLLHRSITSAIGEQRTHGGNPGTNAIVKVRLPADLRVQDFFRDP
jgi:hypothetical protein